MGKTNPGDMVLSVDGQHLIVRFSEYGLGRFHIQWSCRGISKEFELNFLSSLHWSEDGGLSVKPFARKLGGKDLMVWLA